MSNFARVLAMTWAYRGRLCAALVFALLGAALWGINISAVYPVMEVLVRNRSVHEWLEERAVQAERAAAEIRQRAAKGELGEATARARYAERVWQARLCRRLLGLADRVLPRDPFATLATVIGLSVVGMCLAGFCRFANEAIVRNITQRTMYDLRARCYFHVLRLDLAHFQKAGSYDLMARLTNDMEIVSNGIKLLLGRAIREPLRIVACVALAAWINWRLTLLVITLVPGVALLLGTMSNWLRRAARRHQEAVASLYGVLQETFRAIKTVKVFRAEPAEKRRFLDASRQYYRRAMRMEVLESAVRPILEVAAMCAIACALLVGGYLVLSGETHVFGIRLATEPMSMSSLTLVYAALLGIMDPVRKLSKLYGRVQAAQSAANRVWEVLRLEPTIDVPVPGSVKLPRHSESIEFDGVEFAYQPGVPVLKDINLRIKRGQTVALVGPNGSGKSTLVALIPRLFDPTKGAVRIDGHDIRTVRLRSLRDQIGYMTQEVILFDDTILANIRYGCPWASDEDVVEAARKAFADDFIRQLPDGYHTRVGEHGSRLSGGQRQRIALARVILRNPSIVILDEATSAIDAESEALILRALRNFCRDRTTFVVSHRLDTLDWVDLVVVMDHGHIECVGQLDEVIQRSAVFNRLIQPRQAAA